ncbi:hypothetical protein OsJ_15321 [Oryza sativa Japonica Group]|uniref:Uncharacterized protein n=1 Tax=Oryza sativa subsp. japonica TaxID=39947 RepID=B9FFX2_ORYSJ|nr:hypothetical protein OsJ_15321 [Oryza sativa Japonica Group]
MEVIRRRHAAAAKRRRLGPSPLRRMALAESESEADDEEETTTTEAAEVDVTEETPSRTHRSVTAKPPCLSLSPLSIFFPSLTLLLPFLVLLSLSRNDARRKLRATRAFSSTLPYRPMRTSRPAQRPPRTPKYARVVEKPGETDVFPPRGAARRGGDRNATPERANAGQS